MTDVYPPACGGAGGSDTVGQGLGFSNSNYLNIYLLFQEWRRREQMENMVR